jgi:hypothetical protein
VQPIEDGRRGAADQQFIRRRVPQQRVRLAAQEAPVGRLHFQPVARRLARLAPLPVAGLAAGVAGRQRLQLDERVGPQQVRGNLLRIDAQREVQGVVDDVLGQVEGRIENVIAGGPARLDAVGGGQPLSADAVRGQALQVLRSEHPGGRAGDAKAREGDPAGEKSHARSLPLIGRKESSARRGREGERFRGGGRAFPFAEREFFFQFHPRGESASPGAWRLK